VQLDEGANRLVAEIAGAPKGATPSRALSWASKDFPLEPVPPTILTHPADKELDAAAQVREGRLLFAQLNCAACHADAAPSARQGTGMQEHGQNAPCSPSSARSSRRLPRRLDP
jgi:mono/diheme cytochrome c family protein